MSFNHFGRIASQLEDLGRDIDRETREEIAADAQARAAVDTGELRDGIQVTEDGVVSTAPHSAPVEYGTSDTAAQPFLTPAAEAGRDGHIERWRGLEGRFR